MARLRPGDSWRARVAGIALATLAALPLRALAQSEKEINQQAQFWTSLNTTTRLDDRWGIVGDVHIRRNDFIRDPSFYLARFGANYWVTDRLTWTLGYAHAWHAPAHPDWHTWTAEDRLYQQVQYRSDLGRAALIQRLRNEQRWRQTVKEDDRVAGRTLSDRVRYQFSLTLPVSARPAVPSLALSNEILVQFGPAIVNNTFDQDRVFAGIKKELGRSFSFDLGYMLVYQQKESGYQYDLNHTLRLFFYFTPDLRKSKGRHDPAGSEE